MEGFGRAKLSSSHPFTTTLFQVQVSIIIPVFNEARLIQPFLARLRGRTPGAEIIVVDGASTDGTYELAAGFCDQVIHSAERNRAIQMNAGARAAFGDTFCFLHADCEVPVDCLHQISEALRNSDVVGGFFRIRIPDKRVVYRLTDSFARC